MTLLAEAPFRMEKPLLSKESRRRVKFGDVVTCTNENSRNPLEDGFTRYVGLDDLDPGELRIRRWGDVADGTTFTRVFRSGQVLFGKRRAYQRKAALADFDGICSGDILVFEAKADLLLPDLLPFIVQSDGFFDRALGTSAGSLSPRTKWSELSQYEFDLPPLDEQRRIAEVLRAVEEISESYDLCQQEAIRLLDTLLRVSVERFWSEVEQRAIRMMHLGDALGETITNGIFKRRHEFGSGTLLINVKDLYTGISVDTSALDRVTTTLREQERFSALSGDVIFNRSSIVLSGIGKASLVPENDEPMVFECHLMRVRPNPELLLPAYLTWYASSRPARDYITSAAKTTTMTTINQGDIESFPIPVPGLATQAALVEKLNAVDGTISEIRKHIKLVKTIKCSLLARLFQT